MNNTIKPSQDKTVEKQTSTDLKRDLMNHLFWRLSYPIVIDEHQFMDIFAVRRSEYTVEFEIKISKSDLLRETKLLKTEQPTQYSKDWVKWEKHAHYTGRKINKTELGRYSQRMIELFGEPTVLIPNEFYFYVPSELEELALRETIGTPYGIVVNGLKSNGWHDRYQVVKKAKKLHSNKADTKLYQSLAHGLTIRNRYIKEANQL